MSGRTGYLNTTRGLAALILILLASILQANYLYKDEITANKKFQEDVELLGKELHDKTGIAVRLIMLKKLPKGMSISEYEKEVASQFNEPTVLLTFSELDQKVDILARPQSLYQYFDKRQILSPVASYVQSLFMAIFFSHSWKEFKETVSNYGGTIIPLLAQKSKKGEDAKKYATAMFNGYADLVGQIAKAKGIKLEHAVGDANQHAILFIKILFYGFILYAIILYIKRKFFTKRQQNDA